MRHRRSAARRSACSGTIVVSVRPPSRPPEPPGSPTGGPSPHGGVRLNLLLSTGLGAGPAGWADETWADQLPRLLQPLGVQALVVHSGREAADAVRRHTVHLAVVDLSLPMECGPAKVAGAEGAGGEAGVLTPNSPLSGEEAGCRLLQLLGRQPSPPPTIVIKPRRTRREDARALMAAMQAGAFAVIDRPVHLEAVLDALRRALRRHYADRWPGGAGSG